ncbi:hypothetical protein M9H77_14020 [Catharanthus roseus]|uniref:Uncharacterized protein n=1 Tax=Catharanthus roseus TaxID=4058 RepID=A0ACC0BLZ6_CATRO|nr:hypothetical protein M9H77_14020 [Catharanthus roseus]
MNQEGEWTPSSGCISQATSRHHRRVAAEAAKKKGGGRGRVIARSEEEKAASENEERRGVKGRVTTGIPASLTQSNCTPTLQLRPKSSLD